MLHINNSQRQALHPCNTRTHRHNCEHKLMWPRGPSFPWPTSPPKSPSRYDHGTITAGLRRAWLPSKKGLETEARPFFRPWSDRAEPSSARSSSARSADASTRSATRRSRRPSGDIEWGWLIDTSRRWSHGAEAQTGQASVEKATRRAGVMRATPAPAVLSLARPLSPCTISRASRCIETLELMQQLDKSPATRRPLAAR
eukprot:scaffold4240_cov73-Phaeocystis_antarctica.AAC.8